jgi:hypothetical protein
MKIIAAIMVNDVICPASEFPDSAIKIVFDGTEYVIYEEGDELPPEPIYDERL